MRVAVLVDLSQVTGFAVTDFDDTRCSLCLVVLGLLSAGLSVVVPGWGCAELVADSAFIKGVKKYLRKTHQIYDFGSWITQKKFGLKKDKC